MVLLRLWCRGTSLFSAGNNRSTRHRPGIGRPSIVVGGSRNLRGVIAVAHAVTLSRSTFRAGRAERSTNWMTMGWTDETDRATRDHELRALTAPTLTHDGVTVVIGGAAVIVTMPDRTLQVIPRLRPNTPRDEDSPHLQTREP